MRRIGVEPLFIMKLTWPNGIDHKWFSEREFLAAESPIEEDIHGHVLSFGAISSVAKTDGFGSLETTQVILHDFFGLFKETLEQKNLYDFRVELYLVVKQPPYAPTLTRILYGRFSDPIEWDEHERTISMTVVSDLIFDMFGHLPDYVEHQYLNANLTGSAWPHVFGALNTYRFQPICNNPNSDLARDIVIVEINSNFPLQDSFAATYPDTADTNFYNASGLNSPSLYVNELQSFPHYDEGLIYYQLTIPGGSVLLQARNNLNAFLDVLNNDYWNIPYFTNIVCWGPEQYKLLSAFPEDKEDYVPNTITLLGYGSFTGLGDPPVNISGEVLGWPGEIEVAFPLIGDNPDSEPWLRGQYIFYRAFRVQRLANGDYETLYINLWAKVIEQIGFTLILEEITNEYGQEWSNSGYRPCFIHYTAYNKVFYPSPRNALGGGGSCSGTVPTGSMTRWPEPPVKVQRGNKGNGIYLSRSFVDEEEIVVYDRAYHIPKGSSIKPVNWWPTMMYPITLDVQTSIGSIGIVIGNRHIPLNIAQYTFLKYDAVDEPTVSGRWTYGFTNQPATTPIVPTLYLNQDFADDYLPEQASFLILKPSVFNMMLRDLAATDIALVEITAGNEIDTDERVFKYVLEKYTNLIGVETDDLYYHSPCAFKVMRREPVTNFLGQFVWEHAKLIRIEVNQARLIDLLKPIAVNVPKFSEENIENTAFKIGYTADSDIFNRLEATPMDDWTKGKIIEKNQESIDRFTERILTVEIGYNRLLSELTAAGDAVAPYPDPLNNSHWEDSEGRLIPTDDDEDEETPPIYVPVVHLGRGYNRVLKFWLHEYSKVWMLVSFNTFLDAIIKEYPPSHELYPLSNRIVGSDNVRIQMYGSLDFIQPGTGIPLNVLPEYGSGALPIASGIVSEITINPAEWSISMGVKLPIELGTTLPQYVVEE